MWFLIFALLGSGPVHGGKKTEPVFSFGLIADIQYCPCDPLGTRFYAQSLKKLEACVKDFNSRDLSFVIQLGDLIDRDIDSYEPVLSVFNQIETKKYHVLGNHDYSVEEEAKPKVPSIVGLNSPYYNFVLEGWRFVVLNSNDLSVYTPFESQAKSEETEALFQKLKARGAVNRGEYNGGLSSRQIKWLKNILNQASLNKEKVLLFSHLPVYPPREENLWNDIELINLLEDFPCVQALISGHYHSGSYAKKRGIHYLTLRGLVETEDQSAYAILEVHNDFLNVLGFGREPSRILPLREDNI